jgi:SAM-dependent methyltransferase
MRDLAYGQGYNPTLVDRFGVWLSSIQIRRHVSGFDGKRVGDFGCGYHAALTRPVLDRAGSVLLVDVAIADDLKAHPKVQVMEGAMPAVLRHVPSESLDVLLCISVLEHLAEPLDALQEFHRIAAGGAVCLFNVPSWRGKRFLEYSAFRLGLSPKAEMDDHKMYYDVRDFWPLLVRAGFVPSNIRCFSHKFGLNTFAACRVDKAKRSDDSLMQ